MMCFKKILINILISFKLILIVFPSFALKDCPIDQQAYKHNCYGKYEFDSGEKYIFSLYHFYTLIIHLVNLLF